MFEEVPTIHVIMYSVDNRDSFGRAAQTLFRLYGNKSNKNLSVLLVANKLDLQRKRRVTSIGKFVDLDAKKNPAEITKVLDTKSSVFRFSASLYIILFSISEGKMLAKIYKCGFVEVSVLLTMNMDSIWKEIIRRIQHFVAESEKIYERRESRGTLKARIVERGRRFAKSCETLVAKMF